MSILGAIWAFFSPRYRRRRQARQKVDQLLARGAVEKVLLLPAELGGPDSPGNVVYLPPKLAEWKRNFDRKVRECVERGEELDFAAIPEYEGDSFVPVRLNLRAVGEKTRLEVVIHNLEVPAGET